MHLSFFLAPLLAAITAANRAPVAAPAFEVTAMVDCKPVPAKTVTHTITSDRKYTLTEINTKYKPRKVYITVTETKYRTKTVKQTVFATKIDERKAKKVTATTTVMATNAGKRKKGGVYTIAG